MSLQLPQPAYYTLFDNGGGKVAVCRDSWNLDQLLFMSLVICGALVLSTCRSAYQHLRQVLPS